MMISHHWSEKMIITQGLAFLHFTIWMSMVVYNTTVIIQILTSVNHSPESAYKRNLTE